MKKLIWDQSLVKGNFDFVGQLHDEFLKFLSKESTNAEATKIEISPLVFTVLMSAINNCDTGFVRANPPIMIETDYVTGWINNVPVVLDAELENGAKIYNNNLQTEIILENVSFI